MSAVYSTLFIAAGGVGVVAGYTVPAGKLMIVRDADFFFDGLLSNSAVSLIDSATSTWLYYHLMATDLEYVGWRGRQVLPAGATLTAYSSGPAYVAARVSGYLLDLP